MRNFLSDLIIVNTQKLEIESLSLNKYLKYIFVTTIVFFILCIVFPFYYETGSESHFKIIASGIFTGNPQGIFNSFGAHIIIGKVMAFFYRIIPNFYWYDFFICSLFGILIGHILLIFSVGKNAGNSFKILIVGIFLFSSINFIILDPTRLSLLLVATSIILLLNFNMSLTLRFWVLMMFIIGVLIRVETGVLAVIFVTIAEIAYKGFSKRYFRKFSYFYIILILILGFINLPVNDEEVQYLKIRPYQFALWDYYNEFPEVVLESESDSVIFYSATKSFMADESKINEDFFKRVGLNTTDKTPLDILNYLKKIPSQLSRSIEYYVVFVQHQTLVWLYLILMIVIFLIHFKRFIPTILVVGSILISLITISVLMKMESRLFYSMITLLLILTFFYGTTTSSMDRFQIPLSISFLIFLISSFQLITSSNQYLKNRSAYTNKINQLKAELAKIPKSSVVFLDLTSTIHWYNYMFEKEIPLYCNVIPMDNGLIYLTKSQQNKLEQTFGCHDFPCYIERFVNMENAYFLASPDRKSLFDNYMSTVYNTQINFSENHYIDSDEIYNIPRLSIYSLSKIQVDSSDVKEY